MKSISIDSLFSEIESADFYARLALINDFNSFLVFLKSNSSIQELINIIRMDLINLDLIKKRIGKLWNFNCDRNKLHPYDHSIAIYLYVIFDSFKEEVEEILKFAYKNKLGNLYWTYRIYNYILKNLPRIITNFCETHQIAEFDKDNITYIDTEATDSD